MELRRKERISYGPLDSSGDEEDNRRLPLLVKRKKTKPRPFRKRAHLLEISPIFKDFFPPLAFMLPGGFCISDLLTSNSEYHGFHTVNYFRTVNRIEYDAKRGLVHIYLNHLSSNHTIYNWKYVCDRFESASDVSIKRCADLLRVYGTAMEKWISENKEPNHLMVSKQSMPDLKDEYDEDHLPGEELKIPSLWTRRSREWEKSSDLALDKVVFNDALLKLLRFSTEDFLDYSMIHGIHPVMASKVRTNLLIKGLNSLISGMKRPSPDPDRDPLMDMTILTREKNLVDVKWLSTLHVSRSFKTVQHQIFDASRDARKRASSNMTK
eukprot:TRINITY_DN112_c0_g1_i2.p1 TRINITY_DN112_c0_g1~~TRINITY_DN112_c0_g1_i2.p1  ORF type:complete len:324 (-),score=21.14 TRINITY_DN112_c0_g1_i2:143-1114(-)